MLCNIYPMSYRVLRRSTRIRKRLYYGSNEQLNRSTTVNTNEVISIEEMLKHVMNNINGKNTAVIDSIRELYNEQVQLYERFNKDANGITSSCSVQTQSSACKTLIQCKWRPGRLYGGTCEVKEELLQQIYSELQQYGDVVNTAPEFKWLFPNQFNVSQYESIFPELFHLYAQDQGRLMNEIQRRIIPEMIHSTFDNIFVDMVALYDRHWFTSLPWVTEIVKNRDRHEFWKKDVGTKLAIFYLFWSVHHAKQAPNINDLEQLYHALYLPIPFYVKLAAIRSAVQSKLLFPQKSKRGGLLLKGAAITGLLLLMLANTPLLLSTSKNANIMPMHQFQIIDPQEVVPVQSVNDTNKIYQAMDAHAPMSMNVYYTRPVPIKVNTISEAVELILQGTAVELPELSQVNTLIQRLAEMALEARFLGRAAPTYDLCDVSVAGSNIFCSEGLRTAEFPDGIPRLHMPQLGGVPVPGSAADQLPRNPLEPLEVNGAEHFIRYLKSLGIHTSREQVRASSLKAAQRELLGSKIASMMFNEQFHPSNEPIFVSRDNYIVDGHHRWAALVGRDTEDGKLSHTLPILRVDAPISETLLLANQWSKQFGIQQKHGNIVTTIKTGGGNNNNTTLRRSFRHQIKV